ncbi:hypothetical protein [Prosthecobacter sp.]|uniref:hypothetical protein n=1 Tax=Prosthecobacter sp. TaxID=1965333 RepID=UPI002ABBE56B|nr:hypothetical protein [Prosthecobacter sp.]MDZ4401859.1 hypothetical protein [Prosthecobacter sp.]
MKTTTLIITGLALACGGLAQESKENPKQALQSLMERARDAKAAGRLDEAKELAEQAEKLQRELQDHDGVKKPQKHAEKHPGKDMSPFKGPEAERLQHIMQAVEHLHAAGLHEPAKNIEEIAQNMRRELEERMKHPGEMKAHAELEEMRQQMHRMAEMIEQLQAELRKRDPDKIQPLVK